MSPSGEREAAGRHALGVGRGADAPRPRAQPHAGRRHHRAARQARQQQSAHLAAV